MTETTMTAANVATAQVPPSAWSYESAFARDVDRRFNPGAISSVLRTLAQENSDFDEVVEAFQQERRSTSWLFDAAERVRVTQLAKTHRGAAELRQVFLQNGFAIELICNAVGARPFGAWEFTASWPLLPYQVDALQNLVEGLSGQRGVVAMHRGGRGPKAVADYAVGKLRGAPATALAPAWMLFDACYPDDGYLATVWECERMAASGQGGLSEGDVSVLKALAAAPFLSGEPATPRVVAALMADDVSFDLEGEIEPARSSLDRLAQLGFASKSGSAYEFDCGIQGEPRNPLEGVGEIFGVKVTRPTRRAIDGSQRTSACNPSASQSTTM